MNGVSLLLLLSSLGATAGVELGTGGQPIYTIRIESLLINEMRQGQAIPIVVAVKDRRIRYFKIAITPDGTQRNAAAARASADFSGRSGDLFDYEPTQTENGEIEYAVQISPERLESLIAGKPIEGEIAADIPEVHRFLIFVGVGQLPSQIAAGSATSGSPPSLLNNNLAVQNTAGVRPVDSQSRLGAAPTGRPTFSTPAPATTPRGFNSDPLTQFNTRSAEPRTAWRNGPDQSTIGPPPFTTAGQPTTPSFTNSFNRSSTATMNDRNGGFASQPYQRPYPPAFQDPSTGLAQSGQQNYPPGFATNSQLAYPQVAARPDATMQMPPAPTTAEGWTQTVANNQPVTQQPATQTAAPVPTKTVAEPVERPWTPLIMTTLALFASLGANAYLGWLAWSFFWRFRDAVTESSRARSHQSSLRQAA